MIYFDHAATTPPDEEVVQTVAEVMRRHYGNPSSLHRLGEEGEQLLRRAREVCAIALGAKIQEIVFTSGATESNNQAIKGVAFQYRNRGRHIITTKMEHPSVYESCQQLKLLGYEVTYLPVNEEGVVSAEQVVGAIRKDTILVSIMHVNNETGSVQPIHEIGQRIKQHNPRVLFHVDGVQGFGKLPLSISDSRIDLYSISAHKFRGPKGVGLLFVRNGVTLLPLLSGGGQEGGLRSGTENVPNIVGMAKAVRKAAEGQVDRRSKLESLRSTLLQDLHQRPGLVINSPVDGAPHLIHFSYPGMKSEVLVHMLEQTGIYVSTTSACSSKKNELSRVLLAMGRSEKVAGSGIRISLCEEHTQADIRQLLCSLDDAISKLQGLKGGDK